MATNKVFTSGRRAPAREARDVPIQVCFRIPFWYHEHLTAIAREAGTTLPTLVIGALERTYKPERPK